jgi:hypothetical protein
VDVDYALLDCWEGDAREVVERKMRGGRGEFYTDNIRSGGCFR